MTELDETKAYKLSEMAEITGVPQSTLTKWARNGQINAQKVGRLWRISGKWIQDYLDNGAKGGLAVVGKDSMEMKGLRRRARRHGMKIFTDRNIGLFYLVDASIGAVVSPALDESGISSWLDDYDKEG